MLTQLWLLLDVVPWVLLFAAIVVAIGAVTATVGLWYLVDALGIRYWFSRRK